MRKTTVLKLVITSTLVCMAVALATPAAAGSDQHRTQRLSRSAELAPSSVQAIVLARFARALDLYLGIVNAPTGPANGTYTISDDPDPTSDAPIGDPDDPGNGDPGGGGKLPPIVNDNDRPGDPGEDSPDGSVHFGS